MARLGRIPLGAGYGQNRSERVITSFPIKVTDAVRVVLKKTAPSAGAVSWRRMKNGCNRPSSLTASLIASCDPSNTFNPVQIAVPRILGNGKLGSFFAFKSLPI